MTIIYRKEKNNKMYYVNKSNKEITNSNTIKFINSLVIPPAYRKVVINTSPNVEIISTGYDVKGKKQYIYSKKHVERVTKKKFCDLINFGNKIEKIKKKLMSNLNKRIYDTEKIISIILSIILLCNFRIGNESCKRN